MERSEILKMRQIDARAQKGEAIPLNEMRFFNQNLDRMIEYLREDYENWLYRTHKFPRN